MYNFLLQLADAQVVDIRLDNPQRVGVAHAALPALDNDDRVVVGQDIEFQRLGNCPLDTSVDILLPVDLGEIGLLLGKVEGVHATIQVRVPGRRSIPGHHEDGAHGTVLGQQAGRVARCGQNNDTTGIQVERSTHRGHGTRLSSADGPLDEGRQLLKVRHVWDGVLGLEAGCEGALASALCFYLGSARDSPSLISWTASLG